MPIRVVLVDDHQVVLHGLQQLFDGQQDFDVVACCRDGASAITAVETHRPDVLVLDLRMPERSGLDVLRALSGRHERCRRVVLTAAIRNEEVIEAVTLGATGLVLKESSPEMLLECVRSVHTGGRWIDRDTWARAIGWWLDAINRGEEHRGEKQHRDAVTHDIPDRVCPGRRRHHHQRRRAVRHNPGPHRCRRRNRRLGVSHNPGRP